MGLIFRHGVSWLRPAHLFFFCTGLFSATVAPNSDPSQIITSLVLVGVGEGLGVALGLGNQIYFNERGNNLVGCRKWAQHRLCAFYYPLLPIFCFSHISFFEQGAAVWEVIR